MRNKIVEQGIIAGNVYNKYNTKNPIARILVRQFLKNIIDIVSNLDIHHIHEVGCGEGFLSDLLSQLPHIHSIKASDFSSQIIAIARKNFRNKKIKFYVKNIYDLDDNDSAELVICCEVLEHLKFPDKALLSLQKISKPYCLLSVPREPLWRILNLLRGKYILDLGNTPGHIQHWSKQSFINLIKNYFSILEIRSPIPWTIILAKSVPSKQTF